jgi:hypothetical protein
VSRSAICSPYPLADGVQSWQYYRVHINYQRISLRHNLSRKCRKFVKFVSITHSERNIWNGPTAISREKCKPVLEGNGCLTDQAYLVCPGIFVAVQRAFRRQFGRRSEGGMNNFVTEDASVIKFCGNTPIIYTHPVFTRNP